MSRIDADEPGLAFDDLPGALESTDFDESIRQLGGLGFVNQVGWESLADIGEDDRPVAARVSVTRGRAPPSVGRIIIVGGGTAGWMSAAYLERAFLRQEGSTPSITVVESPDIGVIGVGEATVPNLRGTLRYLDFDENEFMRRTNASFKNGIKFKHWRVSPTAAPDEHYYHPFEFAPLIDDEEFWPYWLSYRAAGGTAAYDYSSTLGPATCEAGVAPRDPGTEPYLGFVGYAYHLDAVQFGRMLREEAMARGVGRVEDTVTEVLKSEDGAIAGIRTEEHGVLEADLFVDCTGFRGLLIGKALEEPFIPFAGQLLCDRAVAIQTPNPEGGDISPYTTSTARDAGWTWRIGLYSRTGNGYVYGSDFISDDEAEAELRRSLGPAAEGCDARRLLMRVGRSRNTWVKNCIAIGLASGFVEPLESTGIYLIERSLELIAQRLPLADMPAAAASFNAKMNAEFDEIRDFISLHYCLTERDDTAFWRANREDLAVSDVLRERLEYWRRTGYPSLDEDENTFCSLFHSDSWTYILAGMGWTPSKPPTLPDGWGQSRVREMIERRMSDRARITGVMSDHHDYLRRVHEGAR